MGKAYLGMASTFAEWERNTIVERSQLGIRKAVENGIYSGGIVAYGYRLNPNTKKLEIDEPEGKIVRDMFSWILENGQSCITVAKRLNAMGIPTRYVKDGRGVRGKGTAGIWRPGRVCNMLKNPAYKGEWEYGKRSKKGQTIAGICPAIIDEQTFAPAQVKLRNNNHWSDRTRRRPYLLRSLIKCNFCGHNFTGCTSRTSNNREQGYYRCNVNVNRGRIFSERCPAPNVKADIVEELVWQQICEIILNPEIAKQALEDKFDACNQAEYVAELAEVKHGVKGLETLLTTLDMVKKMRLWGDPEPVYYRSSWVRADNGGILLADVSLGSTVRKGDLLGTITDPMSNARSELRSPFSGRIIGMARNQVVMPGFAAFHVGIQADDVEAIEGEQDPADLAQESRTGGYVDGMSE